MDLHLPWDPRLLRPHQPHTGQPKQQRPWLPGLQIAQFHNKTMLMKITKPLFKKRITTGPIGIQYPQGVHKGVLGAVPWAPKTTEGLVDTTINLLHRLCRQVQTHLLTIQYRQRLPRPLLLPQRRLTEALYSITIKNVIQILWGLPSFLKFQSIEIKSQHWLCI